MVSKGRHPKKVVDDALSRLCGPQFRIDEIHRGHRWGKLTCLTCGDDLSVWSTPRVPEDMAKEITRFVARRLLSYAVPSEKGQAG